MSGGHGPSIVDGGGRVLTVRASDGLTSTTRCRRSCSCLFLFSKMILILPC